MFTIWDNGATTWDSQTTIWDYLPDGFSRVILVCPASRTQLIDSKNRTFSTPLVSRKLLATSLQRIFEVKGKLRVLELSPDLYKVTCR